MKNSKYSEKLNLTQSDNGYETKITLKYYVGQLQFDPKEKFINIFIHQGITDLSS